MPQEPTDADLDELARRARVADAVRDRHRQAAVAGRRREGASVVSVLLGALDAHVTLHTAAGVDPIAGTVCAVGDDVVELLAEGRRWWVRLTEVTAVGAATAGPAGAATSLAPGDPADRSTTSLEDLLADLADADRPLTLLLRGGTRVHGAVDAVGTALWLRTDRPAGTLVVALDQIVAVLVRGDAPLHEHGPR